MTERKPPGIPFRTWVDAQVARGIARGDFDDLPGAGRPLTGLDREQSAYDWALGWAKRENADVRGLLPPGLSLRKEKDELPRRVLALPSETAVRAVVEDFNDRVRAFWRRPQEGPLVAVGLADADDLVAAWRAARPPVESPPSAAAPPAPGTRRRWWRFLRGPQPPGRTRPHS